MSCIPESGRSLIGTGTASDIAPVGLRFKALFFRRGWRSLPWVLNIAALVILLAWLAIDPRLADAFEVTLESKNLLSSMPGSMWVLTSVAMLSMLQLLGSIAFSRTSLSRVLCVLTLLGSWFALCAGYQDVSWQGRRVRAVSYRGVLSQQAQRLNEQWPKSDGDLEGLGPYMAYPVGRPSCLLLLAPLSLGEDGPFVSAIERSSTGHLFFELTGRDGDAWLVHGAEDLPDHFLGGLQERFEVERATSVGQGWHLVELSRS